MAVALFTLGIGGVHELVEWSTTLAMGPERGMLKLDPNDPFDTQKDLLNNLCGAMLATGLYSMAGMSRDPDRLSQSAANVPNPE